MPTGHPIPEDVRDDVVDLLVDAISQKWHKSQMKTAIRECFKGSEFADPSTATIERLISEARAELRNRLGVDRGDEKLNAIAVYEAVIRDPNATHGERIKAQERIDKILGLENKGGADDADDRAKAIRDELAKLDGMFE